MTSTSANFKNVSFSSYSEEIKNTAAIKFSTIMNSGLPKRLSVSRKHVSSHTKDNFKRMRTQRWFSKPLNVLLPWNYISLTW